VYARRVLGLGGILIPGDFPICVDTCGRSTGDIVSRRLVRMVYSGSQGLLAHCCACEMDGFPFVHVVWSVDCERVCCT